MLTTILLTIAGAMLSILIAILPVWSPWPSDLASLFASIFGYVNGMNWFIPINDLWNALAVGFTIDLILLSWRGFQWIRHNIPFLHH